MASPLTIPSASFAWDQDALTSTLVTRLQKGEEVETREFLRLIFRLTKIHDTTSEKTTTQNTKFHDNIVKAFALADWMVDLATTGDVALRIPTLPKLQPHYAYNILVTMGQRLRNHHMALQGLNI